MQASLDRWRVRIGLLLLSLGGAPGCANTGPPGRGANIVQGYIQPQHFRFQTINKRGRGKGPAGWRAVCIHAVMKNGNTGNVTLCKFEVGVPFRSERDGELSSEEAQRLCAYWANAAAHQVLKQAHPGELTAVLCHQFKVAYQELLRRDIAPATVSECLTPGLAPVTFELSPLDFFSPL